MLRTKRKLSVLPVTGSPTDIQLKILEKYFTPPSFSSQRSNLVGSWVNSFGTHQYIWVYVLTHIYSKKTMPRADIFIKHTSGLPWGSVTWGLHSYTAAVSGAEARLCCWFVGSSLPESPLPPIVSSTILGSSLHLDACQVPFVSAVTASSPVARESIWSPDPE